MTRSICFAVLFGIVQLLDLTGIALAANPAGKSDPAATAVEKALRRETIAQLDRRVELKDVLEQQPESAAARWQAGFVRDGKAWRPAEQFGATGGDDAKLSSYREHRENTAQTAAAQLDLANWCHQNNLPDQERAHLHVALALSPNQGAESILDRLGYVSVGGQWLTREQLTDWQDSNRRALAALKTWGPKLDKLAAPTTSKTQRQDAARDALKEMNGPDVIPAIEYTLCGRDEASASVAIDMFNQIGGPEGTAALAKQAIFSKWSGIRDKATAALKTRKLEDFAPSLVSLLATPVQQFSRVQLLNRRIRGSRNSQLVLISSYILARETDDQFQVAVLKTVDYRLNEPIRGMIVNPRRIDRRTNPAANTALLRVKNDAVRYSESEAYERKKIVDAFNERTEELNGRIVSVLTKSSGLPPATDPNSWWTWWTSYSDTSQTGNKQVVNVVEEEVKGDPTATYMERSSCFAAGTLVMTESGRRAIEKLRIGDRVLAKDDDTGELAFKPVLHTTVGKPKELVKLRIGGETIVCTNGHRFWISGEGWVKARDLKPQSLAHTVTGNVPVWSVAKGPTAATYNLVVDDFHDYFVGESGLLVQDLPLPRPNDNVVPGLSRRKRAAAGSP